MLKHSFYVDVTRDAGQPSSFETRHYLLPLVYENVTRHEYITIHVELTTIRIIILLLSSVSHLVSRVTRDKFTLIINDLTRLSRVTIVTY